MPILAPENTVSSEGKSGLNEDFQIFWSQSLCTLVFVSVILILKSDRTSPTKDGIHGALTTALVLWALMTLNYHTGACFNPAVAIGQTYFQVQNLANKDCLWLSHYLYIYTGGPALGGLAAGILFWVFEKCHKKDDQHLLATTNNKRSQSQRSMKSEDSYHEFVDNQTPGIMKS